jgi:hypothetical protein
MSKSKCFLFAGVFCLTVIVGLTISSAVSVKIVHAETIVAGGNIDHDTTWSEAGSPYVLTGHVYVVASSTLDIGPGTTVISRKSVSGTGENYGINIYSGGTINIIGSKSKHVKIGGGVGHVSVWQGVANITYADMQMVDIDLQLSSARATVSSSTFSHSGVAAIMSSESNFDVVDSRIENNDLFGILVNQDQDEVSDKKISIHNSVIAGNPIFAVTNRDTSTIDMSDNWWGKADGPVVSEAIADNTPGADKIEGLVKYDPWLTADPIPDLTKDISECCSSVLFIPGLEGSRLFKEQKLSFGFGTISHRLWEPLSNIDIKGLYLDNTGKTIDPTIYSADPIDKALGLKGVYGKLMEDLATMVSIGKIKEWRPFGYDWRKPIDEVVLGIEKKKATTESLIDTVTNMAKNSKTGKVSIVAHSNGGLVSKYLVKKLSDMGKADLIDKVISVAVPYLGTPQAILGLLHGSDQSLAYGLITKESVARELGANMSSAYSLLPSREYFTHTFGPIIAFASSTIAGVNGGKFPRWISDAVGQNGFILGVGEARASASSSDTAIPINGNSSLMSAAETLHGAIDAFIWPAGIINWAIVGWNQVTASGIYYSEKTKCLGSLIGISCGARPVHEKVVSMLGDGTVMAESAGFGANTTLSLNLQSVSATDGANIKHANILESPTTLRLIDSILTSSLATNTDETAAIFGALPSGVVIGKGGGVSNMLGLPVSGVSNDMYLSISTHSPVELHIYDANGNHTGEIQSPDGVEDVYTAYEEDIPGSDFTKSDDGDTYIHLPDDGKQYSLEIYGTGVGEFTLDIERKKGTETVSSVEYPMVPVTPFSVATTSVVMGVSGASSIVKTPLVLDVDGDGVVDKLIQPEYKFDAIAFLETYKQTIQTIAGNLPKGKSIIKRIDKLESLIRAGKLKKAQNLSIRIDRKMTHQKIKGLDDVGKSKILDMFDTFIQQFE